MTPGPASVLVVDDERLIRWSLDQQLRREGYRVQSAENGALALQYAQMEPPDVVLLDVRLPDSNGLELLERFRARDPECLVIMMTAHGGVESAVRAMKLGAHDYLIKPFDTDELKLTLRKALDTRALRREVARLQAEASHGSALGDLVGVGGSVRDLKVLIQRIAQSDATTVLLQGESGTGKDLAARVIHFASARARGPFLSVNCVALPEHLLESELFGHEKGAFTDAKAQKKGLFEQADGGTVYLDEIGDMRLDLQGKVLRRIEEKTFRRIGGVRDFRADVRIIAATNLNLTNSVAAGQFRTDLYYRLKVFPIALPPLRHRPEDILLLARHFIERFSREMRREPPDISPDAKRWLQQAIRLAGKRSGAPQRLGAGADPVGRRHTPNRASASRDQRHAGCGRRRRWRGGGRVPSGHRIASGGGGARPGASGSGRRHRQSGPCGPSLGHKS